PDLHTYGPECGQASPEYLKGEDEHGGGLGIDESTAGNHYHIQQTMFVSVIEIAQQQQRMGHSIRPFMWLEALNKGLVVRMNLREPPVRCRLPELVRGTLRPRAADYRKHC